MALIKQGKKDEAGRLFAAIAKDKSVPESHPRPRRPDRRQPRRRRERARSPPGPVGPIMTKPNHFRVAILIAAALAASGCSVFKKGKAPTTPVLGQRIAVLTSEGDVQVDPATAALPMSLPRAGRQYRLGSVRRNRVQVDGPSRARNRADAGVHRPGRPRQQPDRRGSRRRRSSPMAASTRSTPWARCALSTPRTGAQMWASQTPNEQGQ